MCAAVGTREAQEGPEVLRQSDLRQDGQDHQGGETGRGLTKLGAPNQMLSFVFDQPLVHTANGGRSECLARPPWHTVAAYSV